MTRTACNGPTVVKRALPAMLALFAVLGFSQSCRAAEPGEAAKEADFPELVRLAERYGLPLPPKDAPLVLGNTGSKTMLGSSSTSDDPGIYRPAFLLERLPKGQARVLMGWEEEVVAASADYSPATRPYSLVFPKPALRGYVLECANLSSFVTAVQLAQRGSVGEAEKLWGQFRTAEFIWDILHENVGQLRSDPRLLLARCLYQYFYDSTLAENANLQAIHEKLLRLQKEFPALFSDNPDTFYPYRRSLFVRDLGLTLQTPKPAEGSVEALLVDWGNRTGKFRHLGFFDEHNVDADRPAREIFVMGVKAVPDLAKLTDDRRLTRHVRPAFMRAPADRVRLGDLAKYLLTKMCGSQEFKALESLAGGEDAERMFFEKASVKSTTAGIADYHDVPLWILGQKYPRSLLTICTWVPEQATADTPLFKLVDGIAESKLARREKADALADLCARLTDFHRQRYVLQGLAKLDEPRCATMLRPIIAKLPADVDQPYCECEAASYTHVVMQLHDDDIWKQYLDIAKRASVGLRLEMMNPMDYSYIGDTNKQRRLKFLAAFLDDAAIRDMTIDGIKYRGPCAAFTIKKIEVRDFAAMQIASILNFDDRPTEFWSKSRWMQLRDKVQAELAKQGLR